MAAGVDKKKTAQPLARHVQYNAAKKKKKKKKTWMNEWMEQRNCEMCFYYIAESTLSVSLRSTSECGSVSRIRLPPDINAIKHI